MKVTIVILSCDDCGASIPDTDGRRRFCDDCLVAHRQRWHDKNIEQRRIYKRDWMRRWRERQLA